jgi:hypothetical protein
MNNNEIDLEMIHYLDRYDEEKMIKDFLKTL